MNPAGSANWTLHWLQASGDLSNWQSAITEQAVEAKNAIERLLPAPALDILVQALPGQVIPEVGLVGYAFRHNLFSLTVDPQNRNFAASLNNGTLLRQIIHEAHHCLRMAGPGYGHTLGEALVSEGLAGRFVSYLLGSEPEPWERAIGLPDLLAAPPDNSQLARRDYDHAAWFFGTNSDFPRWLGYSLGYQLADHWLAQSPAVNGEEWISVAADTVIAAGTRAGLVIKS
ncbi:hypothetical protein HFV04_026440 [Pseudomonas sp. BIGb0427]|uniref:DUF2268 domain-containing putative Zn-dependent protease n=1 Tax=unclassified Pseudomonas TaxID=196821 RepID=UPI0016B00495|nr:MULTISPECIES: DUF2268 domain-containing putative Zn-dependent protease [unclassified Pseudomonas]NLU58866.1 DUF2268 domain-containing protein [Pseudomonas sp. BIGb0427]QPG63000.1 hypothetical protein HFV04_026440 [Pseudomonas sp. BIGb0427]UVM65448.1 DUF2268 domain-containing protein [Pseudomonas sp. B21-009]